MMASRTPSSHEGRMDQVCLLGRPPKLPSRAGGMPEARSVEDDDSVRPDKALSHAAGLVVIPTDAVAVQ